MDSGSALKRPQQPVPGRGSEDAPFIGHPGGGLAGPVPGDVAPVFITPVLPVAPVDPAPAPAVQALVPPGPKTGLGADPKPASEPAAPAAPALVPARPGDAPTVPGTGPAAGAASDALPGLQPPPPMQVPSMQAPPMPGRPGGFPQAQPPMMPFRGPPQAGMFPGGPGGFQPPPPPFGGPPRLGAMGGPGGLPGMPPMGPPGPAPSRWDPAGLGEGPPENGGPPPAPQGPLIGPAFQPSPMMGRPAGFAGPGPLTAGPVGMAAPVGFGPGMRPPGPKLSGEVPMVISDFLAGKIAPGTTVRFSPVDPLEGGGGAGGPWMQPMPGGMPMQRYASPGAPPAGPAFQPRPNLPFEGQGGGPGPGAFRGGVGN